MAAEDDMHLLLRRCFHYCTIIWLGNADIHECPDGYNRQDQCKRCKGSHALELEAASPQLSIQGSCSSSTSMSFSPADVQRPSLKWGKSLPLVLVQ